jgi:hypothetical protein
VDLCGEELICNCLRYSATSEAFKSHFCRSVAWPVSLQSFITLIVYTTSLLRVNLCTNSGKYIAASAGWLTYLILKKSVKSWLIRITHEKLPMTKNTWSVHHFCKSSRIPMYDECIESVWLEVCVLLLVKYIRSTAIFPSFPI